MNYLPDVNVWVALALVGHVHHSAARAWFEEPETGQILFSRITQMGLLRLLTNRKVMGANVLAATAAWDVYHALCRDDRVRYAAEPPQLEEFWSDATRHHATGPNFWTDAYLAAFAEAGDYTIVTFDRGIRRHRGVSVRLLEPAV
jgi:uncharacterized protein